ncbi:MAG: hypothetical protein ACI4I6_07285 [Hominimerdicola sp.]
MIQIFKYPPVSRSEIGKRVLVRMIPALLLLVLSMVPMFIFMAKDSEANRNAVRKVSSQETEMSVIAVFILFLLCVVYISIVAIKESRKLMRNFTVWAYYKKTLYNITAVVPRSHANTSRRGMRRIMKAQDSAMDFFNDHYTLKKLLDGEIKNKRILVCEVIELTLLKENKNGVKVLLPNGRKLTIYKDLTDYDIFMDVIHSIQK